MAIGRMSNFFVAIDGPAGSGKSSVSKAVARLLGFGYLDTGAAYRALAWMVQNNDGLTPEVLASDPSQLKTFEANYRINTDAENYSVMFGSENITDAIREPKIAEAVSLVARVPQVREFMLQLTRSLARDCQKPGIIVEGRDITTVVLADAQVRILLTAAETVRLKRRSNELGQISAAAVVRQVSERDASDAKVVDFMTPAFGVVLVDSSDLNFDQTVSAVLEVIEQQFKRETND